MDPKDELESTAKPAPPPRKQDPAKEQLEPDSTPEIVIGSYLGPYRVEKYIARGGMGKVLLARDESLNRDVAVKVMDPSLLNDRDAVKRFEREAKASAAIQHPNVAQVYLVGLSDSGQPFLAMEYINGGSLLQYIKDKKELYYSTIAHMMEQVAQGLYFAQKKGIIHRDIKPANLMLTLDETIKIVDFGLAKVLFEDSFRTREGSVLGTPSYMAPEQGQGRIVDYKADIYALGATFYHLIIGRPPFTGDSPVQIMMKHVTAPVVPMRTKNPHVPIEFDEIIGKCLKKDPNDRYDNYLELISDIQRVRLQCLSREKGAVLNETGEITLIKTMATNNPEDLAPPSTPLSIPEQSALPSQSAIDHLSNKLSLSQKLSIGLGIAVLVFVFIYTITQMIGGLDEESPATTRQDKDLVILEQAAERYRNSSQAELSDRSKAEATVAALQSLNEGLNNYQVIEDGSLPYRLNEIVDESRVFLNFEYDENRNPFDAWGTLIRYNRPSGTLRSAGADRKFSTNDDLVMSLKGLLEGVDSYEK